MTLPVRIGHGFDAHRFAEPAAARPLRLCGVGFDHPRGLLGHSDADVPLHALADALLGAVALGDLGGHFRPGDPAIAGIDSRTIVRQVVGMVGEKGWLPAQADLTILAEEPRLASRVPEMRASIAALLGIDIDFASVKATTSDGLGAIGRSEGIAAWAVVLVAPR